MIDTFYVSIPKLSNLERKAYIYLPTTYNEDDDRRYPVIYMFDGHNLFSDDEATFGRSWRLADYLDYTDTQVIIAAVECNHEGDERLSEYSPIDFSFRDMNIKGKGKKYMEWLVNEFKPYIDSNYKTLPNRENTAIAGHSMGGLMSLYAFLKYNRVFSKAAAISPSIWVKGGEQLDFIKNIKVSKDSILYTSYGELEFKNHEKMRECFAETVELLMNKGVNITARIVKGGRHNEETCEKETPFFMQTLGFMSENG